MNPETRLRRILRGIGPDSLREAFDLGMTLATGSGTV